jgi:hypothetical protein
MSPHVYMSKLINMCSFFVCLLYLSESINNKEKA